MENNQKNSSNFTVIFSEKRENDFEKYDQTTSSSSSSTSNSISEITKSPSYNLNSIFNSNKDLIITEAITIRSKKIEDRKKELCKKREEKMILKFRREEAEKLHTIAKSKCGRFIKYNSKIGEGGYKVVYKGFDKEACCDIAWCEVKREHVDNREKNNAMLKEIEIMLKLDHPNIVKCYAVLKNWWIIREDFENKQCEVKGLVIIQEYMGAGTLKEMIKKNFHDGRCILDIRLITIWLYKILEALRYMHCKIEPPIIHRDVKSENCFLFERTGEEFLNVKIGDFGLATTINQNSQRKTMIGTVGFMAPEVFEEKYDIKVDIYAFGMMILEVMTNKTTYDDCSNIFQVVSKSMGNYLPEVISTITQPLIKEVILACVHPLPIYRPSAEELCEHPLFQNAPLVVDPTENTLSRFEIISNLICQLSLKTKTPIITLTIRANKDCALSDSSQLDFNEVSFSFDIYQAQNNDLASFIAVLSQCTEEKLKASYKKMSLIKKIYDSIRLQILYLIKLINGERWRKIFDDFLQKEGGEKRSQRSNSNPNQQIALPDIAKLISSNSLNLGKNDKYTNNFADYSHKLSVYHKTTQCLIQEIEDYCHNTKEKTLPYFFNLNTENMTISSINNGHESNKMEMNKRFSKSLMKSFFLNKLEKHNSNDILSQQTNNISDLFLTTTKEVLSPNDEVFISSTVQEEKNNENHFVRVELLSSVDSTQQENNINPFINHNQIYSNQNPWFITHNSVIEDHSKEVNIENFENYNQFHNENMFTEHYDYDPYISLAVGYDHAQYRHLSEPIYATNSLYKINQVSPHCQILSQGSYPSTSEANSIHSYYSPHFVFNQDPLSEYIRNYNNLRFQTQHSNYVQGPLNHNLQGLHDGLNQIQFINPDLQFMQTNTSYVLPQDQTCKNPISMSQPVLTGSWPNIVASGPMPQDNVIVSGIYQSYISSTANVIGTQSRSPMSMIGPTADLPFYQRSPMMPNYVNQPISQKFSPPVISTARPISVRPQPSYSTVVSSTKILEKNKKRPKSRLKSKYLIKVINIQENINPAETVLTFEMMLPMHQMRFTCCLSKEINTLDVSNLVGEAGQIPGELGKKDILESLVNTVKKICLYLTDDINSVSLHEDYVFHPCLPNSGLVKLSEYAYSTPSSLDSDNNNQNNNLLNSTPTLHPLLNTNNSCSSSANLSRQPSYEDVSWSMGNIQMGMPDHLCYNLTESDLILFNENDVLKPTQTSFENQNKVIKSTADNEPKLHSIISSKCACPTTECTLKVPEYIFTTVKQIVDKLLNMHCKGIIIIPQSNDILTRNFRVLEIPADHMFVGLPCSDSSYNVIKGQKDKDFIIAKDTRDPQNVSEKCVYQKPSDGAVLLDSSGEIQYIQRPSLIIPSTPGHGNDKTDVKALPSQLTHYKDQPLNCDQIVSVLQSLIQIHNTSDARKDELFDSPVLLEPKSQFDAIDKLENIDIYPQRRSSDGNVSSQMQPQSQIQVERLFCQYVSLPKVSDQRQDDHIINTDYFERDLPKQQIRSRKISNESLDSVTSIRTRATSTVTYGNETESMQSQSGYQKVMVNNNQINLQNIQKTLPLGGVINPVPVQRMPNVPSGVVGQYVLSNPNNVMSAGNIFIQGVPNHALYSSCSQAPTGNVIMSQNNQSVPVVLSNQSCPINYNFPHLLPNQIVLPTGVKSQNQMSQLHQMIQAPSQRMTVPSSMSSSVSLSSSQLMSNMQLLQHSILPTSQHGISTTPMHHSQMSSSFPEQHSILQQGPHVADITDPLSFPSHTRQIQLSNIRQLPTGSSSQYFDPNMINSIMAADNLRIQLKNQQPSNAQTQQSQTTPILLIPHQAMPSCNNNAHNITLPPMTGTPSKMCHPQPSSSSEPISVVDNQHTSTVLLSDVIDNKQKSEQQTIGRFVIRPVVTTDSSETS